MNCTTKVLPHFRDRADHSALATLCRHFVFEPVPEFEPSFKPRLTLRPKGGKPLRLVAAKNPSLTP